VSRPPCRREIVKGQGRLDEPNAYVGPRCGYPRMLNKQQCAWHWLPKQSPHIQKVYAEARLEKVPADQRRARVPAAEWPEGERWCAGCQSFVPLFYTSGSRCKSCASSAAHEQRVQKLYDLAPGEYDALFQLQGGRCFICQRESKTIRLAVDHDHATGKVRGLLCANNENGCNRGVVANLESARDGGLPAARRAVLYLAVTPYERLQGAGAISWEDYVRSEAARLAQERAERAQSLANQPERHGAPF
jgi:hypothetical protein